MIGRSFLPVFCLHVLFCTRTTTVLGFNIEQRDPLVKKAPPGQENSYFGFSVALHHVREVSAKAEKWILVGAPLGQNLQPGTNSSGALFKCPISNSDQDCTQIETDGQRVNEVDYDSVDDSDSHMLKPPQPDEIKNGQWLGVTVRSHKPGGKVIVCAHRYIQSPDLSNFHYGQGLCYLLEPNLSITENPLQYCKGLPTEKLHQQFGFCQIGTSATFVGDNALVGAPGPYTWRGTVFAQEVENEFLERDKTIYKGPLNDNAEPIDKYSYLGISVAGGHIFKNPIHTYVSGAPRSEMFGEVFFFEKLKNVSSNEELKIRLKIKGQQFAASFGYEVLVVDVNNDGYDDVLVGAPFYYSENKGGAVYVYYNLRDCDGIEKECESDDILQAGHEQSRFGFAMTSLGDINKDGYNDVAIGAPYDNGHGAVYIYLGSSKGLGKDPSQVIKFNQLSTFGYSLSGGLDMDNNGYPDLLVGAYESERALLFLTRQIIDIKIKIQSQDMVNINASKKGCEADRFNQNNTCFSVKSCFTIKGAPTNVAQFNVIYRIREVPKIISRIWFNNRQHPDVRKYESTQTVEVGDPGKEYCQEELVYVKEGVSDILSPIKFNVKYTLEDDRKPHTPILNTTSVEEFEATFQKDCGDDDVCESYLELMTGTNLKRDDADFYVVESVNKEFVLFANVSNKRESAYEAKLFVSHSPALSYINVKTEQGKQSNVKCSFKNETLVVCDLGNPFQANATANLQLRFEIRKNTKEQTLDLRLHVNSTSKELSRQTSANIAVILQRVAEFTITGKGTTNLFFGGKVVGESRMEYLDDIGAKVIHRYYIENRGQWDLPKFKVNVQWPYQVSPGAEGKEGKWLLYLESLPKVLGTNSGFCSVNEDVINPLKLKIPAPTEDEPENLLLPDDAQFNNNTNLRRRRRQVQDPVKTVEIDKGGIKRRVVTMDCDATAKCVNIDCFINNLKKENTIYVEIASRIWNSTFVEDYSKVDWAQIRSRASLTILDDSFKSKPDQVFQSTAETLVYPEVIPPYSSVTWWIIGLAVVAGLLLLIVLVVILYKCGFFKRKRAKDKTLSGNLEKSTDEDRTLLQK